jgi:hypothetical protein
LTNENRTDQQPHLSAKWHHSRSTNPTRQNVKNKHHARVRTSKHNVPRIRKDHTCPPTRNEVIKLDRTGKYVLKLPYASRNKDRKLDQHKKKHTPTKIWIKISEAKISQTLLGGWKTRDGKADLHEFDQLFHLGFFLMK